MFCFTMINDWLIDWSSLFRSLLLRKMYTGDGAVGVTTLLSLVIPRVVFMTACGVTGKCTSLFFTWANVGFRKKPGQPWVLWRKIIYYNGACQSDCHYWGVWSWCPIYKSGHCCSFEDQAPLGFIHGRSIFKCHHDITKWKHVPRYCPFVRGIHRSPVNSPHKATITQAFDVPLLLVWTICWTNTWLIGNSRRHDGYLTGVAIMGLRDFIRMG